MNEQMTVAQVLNKTADILAERGGVAGLFTELGDKEGMVRGRVCLLGAMNLALGVIPSKDESRVHPANHIFGEALDRDPTIDAPKNYDNIHVNTAQWFNEHLRAVGAVQGTTEVVALLRKVAAAQG